MNDYEDGFQAGFAEGVKSCKIELKRTRFWSEGEGKNKITYVIEAREYPHDENCELSMCNCASRARRKIKEASAKDIKEMIKKDGLENLKL